MPLPKCTLRSLKSAMSAGLPPGSFVSTDDVVTAHVWRALCAVRCAQLGLPTDSDLPTTCCRSCNFRRRTDPPLGDGYCGNGVSHVWTELTVRELLSMPPSSVAQRLRASLQSFRPETVGSRAQWLRHAQQAGCRTALVFDPHALTVIFSSWVFDWEGADFGAAPVAFDHAAHTPVVVVFVPRPQGDGLNVYASGPTDAMGQLAGLLAQT